MLGYRIELYELLVETPTLILFFFFQCFTGEELLDIYGVDHEEGIDGSTFQEICPALIHQITSGVCQEDDHGEGSTASHLSKAKGMFPHWFAHLLKVLFHLITTGLLTSFLIGSYFEMFTCVANYDKALKMLHYKLKTIFLTCSLSNWLNK